MPMETTYFAMNPWWELKNFDSGIDRLEYLDRLPVLLGRKQIEVIVGGRRMGKTTLIKQFIKRLMQQGAETKDIFYLALDNPSLSATPLSEHLKNMRKIHLHDRERKLFLFLDEVQESVNWEGELKSLYDMENLKLFCSGSTSALIAPERSKLTGRRIITTLYPLAFTEFLSFRNESPSLSEDYKYESLLEDYLDKGGYPENVLNPSIEYLSNLLEDILSRDLIRIYPIKKTFALKDLLRLIASSTGSRTSFNKLGKVLGLSVDTVKEYVHYLEAAFLVKNVEKWTTSHTEKVYAQKKIYLWDTSIRTILTGRADLGALAENAVLMELSRNKLAVGYFAESEKEVDFIVGDAERFIPVEVKFISSLDWTEKKFSGIKLFLRRFPKTPEVLLITKSLQTELKEGQTVVRAIPLWRFLLSPTSYLRALES
jgi:predicted AAA+ superfamily ATPase